MHSSNNALVQSTAVVCILAHYIAK